MSKIRIMIFNRKELIDELQKLVLTQMNEAELLKSQQLTILQTRPAPESWNALECYEHLNLYAQFYIPEISKRLAQAESSNNEVFSPGFIGDYMVKSCMPVVKKKIKTFAAMNTLHKEVSIQVLDNFIDYQKSILEILNNARKVDLNKVKTNISITKLLKLRLGDVLRFLIYHQERHKLQAERAIKSMLN